MKIGSVLETIAFTMAAMYYLTQWLSKPSGSFEIHWVREYLVNVIVFGIKYLYEVWDLWCETCSLKWCDGVIIFAKCWQKLKLGTNKLKLDYKLLPKIFFCATISTEKSTSEIDADLVQNEMKLYLIPSRQLNLSYETEYTCHRGGIVKWHTNYTYVKFSSAFA